MKNKENREKTKRQTYRKPKLEHVQLVVEEAFVDSCKTGTGGLTPKCKNKAIGCERTAFRS